MDEKYIVGSYQHRPVYFDGFLYYMVVDGEFFAIDESKADIRR